MMDKNEGIELDTDLTDDVRKMLDEGEDVSVISRELELKQKDVQDIYADWMQRKMDKLEIGDKVQYVLNIKGYKKGIISGTIYRKNQNSVIVESKDDAYIKKELNGRVVVSIKDILKMY